MRRGRILIFVLLIIVIGLVVVVVAFRSLLGSSQPAQPTTVNVITAGQKIGQGQKITADLLSTITIPQSALTSSEYTEDQKGDLLDNKIAAIPLDQGTIITKGAVTDASQVGAIAGPSWAANIPPGMVAKSIPTTRFSLDAYAINDGAHVNINVCQQFIDVDSSFQSELPNRTAAVSGTGSTGPTTLPTVSLTIKAPTDASALQGRVELNPAYQQPEYVVPSENQRPRTVCQTVLQDVVVLKLGNFPQNEAAAAASANGQAQPQPQQTQTQQQGAPAQSPDIITLIVSPQDSDALDYWVLTNSVITMALRNPNDESRQATNPVTLQFELSQYNIPVPAKLPYASQPRIDALAQPVLPNDIVTTPAK
jgi:Flp pilus assembly protein CpaB